MKQPTDSFLWLRRFGCGDGPVSAKFSGKSCNEKAVRVSISYDIGAGRTDTVPGVALTYVRATVGLCARNLSGTGLENRQGVLEHPKPLHLPDPRL